MLRCTGTPTSTLGGGGGTKLFCSQALKVTNANMTKAKRRASTIPCRTLPSEVVHAGECIGIIPVPQFRFALQTLFRRKSSSPLNSNNPLAVEPETENDAPAKNFCSRPIDNFTSQDSPGLKRGSSDTNKDFVK
jgi:hypothetical protein